MKGYNIALGRFGETVAADFYKKQGYKILIQNYYVAGGELDLVVEAEDVLIFVEVKTRSNEKFGQPIEAVHRQKQLHIQRAAIRYLEENPVEKEVRFDIIEVIAKQRDGGFVVEKINHIPNVIFEVTL